MPLSPNEAMVVFGRKAEVVMEVADGVRMGVQLCQALNQRCGQLEQFIQQNGLQVPAPPGSPSDNNVVPMRSPTQPQ